MNADKLKERNDFIEQAQRLWRLLLNVEVPSARQFSIWYTLHAHDLTRIPRAISEASQKEEHMQRKNKEFTLDHACRFTSAVMNNWKNEEEHEDCAERSEDNMNTQTEKTNEILNEEKPEKYTWGLRGFGKINVPEAKAEIALDSKTGALTPVAEEK